ncbi:MAG: plasminogen-binding N-terminal domain-containing protein [Hydrogenimonas sp.]|nr:plasminogen-binding N-terminal domain-containing protein [Hydrogenimonas sp.]
MFRSLFSIFFLFSAYLFAGSQIPTPVAAKLKQASAKKGVIEATNLTAGMSGIVIRRFDKSHEAIIATAVVTSIDQNGSTVEFRPFKALSQHKLPSIKSRPKAGDIVVLGYLYDRILPIVPNLASYKKAKESLAELTLIHPDLFAVELASERDALPHKNNFQKACTKFHLGLVMFMYKDGSSFIDCISWKRVAKSDLKAAEGELIAPFYNRFGEIEPPFYDFSSYKLKDFDKFYKKVERE